MALNYSHRPIFSSSCMAEDDLVHGGSQEKDIHDILPADPFGMDISSTFTAITGWLEDLGVSDYGGYRREDVGIGESGNRSTLGGVNFWWDTAMDFQRKHLNSLFRSDRFDGFVKEEALGRIVDEGCIRYGCFTMDEVVFSCGDGCAHGSKNVFSHNVNGGFAMEEAFGRFSGNSNVYHGSKNVFSDENSNHGFVNEETFGPFSGNDGVYHGYNSYETMKGVVIGSGDGDTSVRDEKAEEVNVVDEDDVSPHPAMSFALAYLGIHDLLTVERVCKSFRSTVQNDPLLWKSILIDHPLNIRVTDDALLKLTVRAQGHLQCLSLVECNSVTNEGLRRVLESNPRLTKLSVPGCINIKIEGIIDSLKAFQSRAVMGIKHLRVAGRPVTLEQFEELLLVLGIQNVHIVHKKPQYYCRGNIDLACEYRPIDLEICPKCEMVKLVYDCTTKTCQAKDRTPNACRACIRCINRCFQCGRCIDGVVHGEDFFFDYLCLYCLPKKSKCQDGHDIGSSSSNNVGSLQVDG